MQSGQQSDIDNQSAISAETLIKSTPTKVSRFNKKIVLLIATMLLLGIGVVGYLFFYDKKEAPENPVQTNQVQESQDEQSTATSERSINNFVSDKDGLVSKLSFEFQNDIGTGSVVFVDDAGRFISVDAKEYDYIVVKAQTGDAVTLEQVGDLFYTRLTKDGYSEYAEPSQELADAETVSGVKRFKKDSYVCTVSISGYETTFQVSRSCVDRDELADTSSRMTPFYEAYEQSSDFLEWQESLGKKPTDYFIGITEESQKQSVFEGYEYIYGGVGSVQGGGARVAYYRKDKGSWIFAFGTQSLLSCKDPFNTLDMQKAFSHEACYDESNDTQTTVKEYYKL